jgi:hypothetical protein
MVQQSNKKLLLVGAAQPGAASFNVAVVRLNSNGVPDS